MTNEQNKLMQEAIKKINNAINDSNDQAHINADKALLEFLDKAGFSDLKDAWMQLEHDVGFWWA